jgi:methylmalonyl-CoA/ethylmalonyl-CoA epimerase
MKANINKFMQVGIIVRSVDDAVSHYEEDFGIGPWEISTVSGAEPPFTDLTVDGVPRNELICKLAICKRFGIEFELIEPVADSPYSRWLEEHGPGIHHIAVDTDESYDEILESYSGESGRKPWIRATGIGGLMDYSYLDLRDETGLIIECYRNIQPGKTGIEPDYEGTPVTR